MGTVSAKTLTAFRDFVSKAKLQIAATRQDPDAPIDAFRRFVTRATPLAICRAREQLPALMTVLARIEPWLVRHDLLATAGFRLAEDPYTELIAWALSPDTHPTSAIARQEAWLRGLGLDYLLPLDEAARPMTQVVTHDGIPDLVLLYPRFAVVVETKTGTVEHATPSGAQQTVAYAQAVRKRLSLPDEFRVQVVFLTLAGDEPANPDARPTTFVDFALALIAQLDHADLPPDLRWAFGAVFTHFLSCATPDGLDVCDTIRTILSWKDEPGWERDDSTLLRRLPVLEAAQTTLNLE